MKVKMLLLLPSFMGVMLTGCSGGNGTKDQDAMPAIDLTALDTTVNPAEDFYLFANGLSPLLIAFMVRLMFSANAPSNRSATS